MQMNKIALMASAGLGIAFLAACSDSPTAPTAAPAKINAPSFVVVGDLAALGGTPVVATIKVCKVWDGSAGGDAIVTGALTADRDVTGNTTVATPRTLSPNECEVIATTTQPANSFFDDVSVTEAVPAGAELVSVQRFDVGGATPAIVNGGSIGFNLAHGSTIVFTNRLLPQTGNQGCTPGYWKQSQHFGNWPVNLNTTFASVFGAGIYGGSLLEALGANGGGLNALARHAAAGYLNSLSGDVDYAYTSAQVIAITKGLAPYNTLTVEQRKDLLAAANEGVGGCPLARAELQAN